MSKRMTMRKIKFFMMTTLLSLAVPASAVIGTEDFVVGDLAYHITSSSDKTVEVGLSASNWSSITNVTIPSTVTYNGTTYDVTKIANYGFTYKASSYPGSSGHGGNNQSWKVVTITPTASCSNKTGSKNIYSSGVSEETVTGSDGKSYVISIDWQSTDNENIYENSHLTTVNFAPNCKITEIGHLAFAGCTALTSFKVPVSVTTLGPQAFALCTALKNFEFLTYSGENNTQYTNIKTIPVYCFIGCTSLTSLYLPEGIEIIQNRALQYCFNLATVHLPNTLKAIGSHFLCEDHALQSITIPSSVVYMSNGLFHGCCGLTDVYMLGAPATLDAGSTSSDSRDESFGANQKFGGDEVSGCVIWVYADWLDQYKTGDGWKHFLEVSNTNEYKPYPEQTRVIPNRWVTCCLWKDYTAAEVKSAFGEGSKVAYMTSAEVDKNFDSQDTTVGNMYDLTFTVQSLENDDEIVIRKHTPFMLKSYNNEVTVTVYDATTMRQNGEEAQISAEHHITVEADNHAMVQMASYYPDEDYKLAQWECYFKNPAINGQYDQAVEGGMGFYRATSNNFTALKSGRCFWRVVGDPYMTGNGNAKQMVGMVYDVDDKTTTGVGELHVKVQTISNEVYTLSGQRISNENLPKGIYIVNGKKVMVK